MNETKEEPIIIYNIYDINGIRMDIPTSWHFNHPELHNQKYQKFIETMAEIISKYGKDDD